MRFFPAILLWGVVALPCAAAHAKPSLLSALPKAERAYYGQIFDYSMEAIKTGQSYDWQTSTGSDGSITLTGAPFVSKSGATCRTFTEKFTIFGHPGGDSGTGCKRGGKPGWCKLDADSALTCALETPMSPMDNIGHSTDDFRARESSWWNSARSSPSPW